jgi:co-chaperonin GroES (HSP10)
VETEVGAGEKTLSVEEKEQLVNRLTQELYWAHRGFKPRWPWVFIRILDKEQQIGHIIVPENQQNKPMHEGIVLAVWPSFIDSKTVNGQRVTVYKESDLRPGDHILCPHWAGLPVVGYRDTRYRIVKEEGWEASKDGGICATVDYAEPDHKPTEKLRAILHRYQGLGLADEAAVAIQEQFLLVDRDAGSVTLSGR